MIPRLLLLAALLCLGFAPAPFLEKKRKLSPLDELQGSWFDTSGTEARIVGDNLTYHRNGTATGPSYALTLKPTASPREYDARGVGKWASLNFDGIYKIEGDTLTMCSVSKGGSRPKVFAAAGGAGLYIMKRRKP
jgi:uncharacterized protein (TIGR03067 family)